MLNKLFLTTTWTLIGLHALPKLQFNLAHKRTFKFSILKTKRLLKKKSTLLHLKSFFLKKRISLKFSVRILETITQPTQWLKPYLFIGKKKSLNNFSGLINNLLLTYAKSFHKINKKIITSTNYNFYKNKNFLKKYLNLNSLSIVNFKKKVSLTKRKFFKKYLKHRLLQKKLYQLFKWKLIFLKPKLNVYKNINNYNTTLLWNKLQVYSLLALFKLRRKKEFLSIFFNLNPVQQLIHNSHNFSKPKLNCQELKKSIFQPTQLLLKSNLRLKKKPKKKKKNY